MQEKSPIRERWPSTTSVGLLLQQFPSNHGLELVLARKRDSGKLGLIAGGLEQVDNSIEEVGRREFTEETGINEQQLELGSVLDIITLPKSSKSSVGIVLWASLKEESYLPSEGTQLSGKEIDLIKPYFIKDVLSLTKHPESFYRPDFNITAINKWLYYHNFIKIKGKYYYETSEYRSRFDPRPL